MVLASFVYISLLYSILTQAFGQNDCTFPAQSIMKEAYTCCDFPDRIAPDIFAPCSSASNKYCLLECIFNITNLIKNEEINSESLKNHLERAIVDKREFIPIGIRSMQECYSDAKDKFKDLKTKSINGCSVLPAIVAECSYANIFINCPSNRWKTTSDCDVMKSFYKKCPMPSEVETT